MFSKLSKIALLPVFLLLSACTNSTAPTTACKEELLIDWSKAFSRQLVIPDRAASMLVKATIFPGEPVLDGVGLEGYQLNERPLLWTDQEQQQMMIDKEHFSDLQTQDVVSIKDVKTIGRVSNELRENWGYSKLIRFLLESEIIRTYWHLEAQLCLKETHETEQVYEERFSVVHRYCTNECTEDEYQFAVRIEKDSGKIQVRPL